MQISTVQDIVKYVFFAIVLGLLIYILVYVRKVDYGGWNVQSKDNILSFISPDGKTSFRFNQLDNSFGIDKHKIKSDNDSLKFYKDDTFLSAFEPSLVRVGNVVMRDQTMLSDLDKAGVEFKDTKKDETLAYITQNGYNIPSQKLYIKTSLQEGQPVFGVYDFLNNKEIVRASAKAPLGSLVSKNASYFDRASYNIM